MSGVSGSGARAATMSTGEAQPMVASMGDQTEEGTSGASMVVRDAAGCGHEIVGRGGVAEAIICVGGHACGGADERGCTRGILRVSLRWRGT